MTKRNIILLVCGAFAFLASIPLFIQGYFLLTAPKFSTLKYVGTEQIFSCLAIVTDGGCHTTYRYKTTGSETDIVDRLKVDMAKKSYELRDEFAISCGLIGQDLYRFTKKDGAVKDPEELAVYFSPGNVNREGVPGCNNPKRAFDVEIVHYKAQ